MSRIYFPKQSLLKGATGVCVLQAKALFPKFIKEQSIPSPYVSLKFSCNCNFVLLLAVPLGHLHIDFLLVNDILSGLANEAKMAFSPLCATQTRGISGKAAWEAKGRARRLSWCHPGSARGWKQAAAFWPLALVLFPFFSSASKKIISHFAFIFLLHIPTAGKVLMRRISSPRHPAIVIPLHRGQVFFRASLTSPLQPARSLHVSNVLQNKIRGWILLQAKELWPPEVVALWVLPSPLCCDGLLPKEKKQTKPPHQEKKTQVSPFMHSWKSWKMHYLYFRH